MRAPAPFSARAPGVFSLAAMRSPFAVATFVACVWLNQGISLAEYEAVEPQIQAAPLTHPLRTLHFPLEFLYRRSGDEELYFAVANATLGRPTDHYLLLKARGTMPDAFRKKAPTDGHWHRPYAEVPMEYPIAVLPFVLAPALLCTSFDGYARVFGVLMALCLLGASALALAARGPASSPAAEPMAGDATPTERGWFLVALLLAQGALAIQRLDAVPTLFVAMGLWAAVTRRPWALGLAFGAATAAKFVPALLLPPLLLVDRRVLLARTHLLRVSAGFALALLVGFGSMALLSPDALRDVLTWHSLRGLHVESTYGAVLSAWRLLTGTGSPAAVTYGSYNLPGATADTLARAAGPALLGGTLAYFGALALRRGPAPGDQAQRAHVMSMALLGGLALFWLFGKVFSPQYLTWAIPLVLALRGSAGRRVTWLLVILLTLTQVYLRGFYDHVYDVRPLGITTLMVRLAFLVAFTGLVFREVLGPSKASPAPLPAPQSP